jgi:hypothetical protein
MWVLSYSVHDNLKLSAKAHSETCLLCFVPILSVEDFGARSGRKNGLHHSGQRLANSACNCSQVTAPARS